MKTSLYAAAIAAILIGPAFASPGHGHHNGWDNPNNPHSSGDPTTHGAPAPLLAAGLPMLAFVGGGAYLLRRFRRK